MMMVSSDHPQSMWRTPMWQATSHIFILLPVITSIKLDSNGFLSLCQKSLHQLHSDWIVRVCAALLWPKIDWGTVWGKWGHGTVEVCLSATNCVHLMMEFNHWHIHHLSLLQVSCTTIAAQWRMLPHVTAIFAVHHQLLLWTLMCLCTQGWNHWHQVKKHKLLRLLAISIISFCLTASCCHLSKWNLCGQHHSDPLLSSWDHQQCSQKWLCHCCIHHERPSASWFPKNHIKAAECMSFVEHLAKRHCSIQPTADTVALARVKTMIVLWCQDHSMVQPTDSHTQSQNFPNKEWNF